MEMALVSGMRGSYMMGFAQHHSIGQRAEHGKAGDEGEFRTPAEIVVERAAE